MTTTKQNNSGTYVYDKKTGKIVKISDEVPSVKKEHSHSCSGNCGCRGCPHD